MINSAVHYFSLFVWWNFTSININKNNLVEKEISVA
ncbi:UNVERIFIED_ORG: hypothetical protein DFS12_104400 [Chitinophaga ginsengisegetis]|nr:hypothetical protein [Chitinophaga ginsengisegetis]MDR6648341.1 hypothetical protein [Chitinophaga ginsengisegetis]MDR6654509.1 hypothetical protein [Chitinophaga ginsengisegetis]